MTTDKEIKDLANKLRRRIKKKCKNDVVKGSRLLKKKCKKLRKLRKELDDLL